MRRGVLLGLILAVGCGLAIVEAQLPGAAASVPQTVVEIAKAKDNL
jgi:hypothetical protein